MRQRFTVLTIDDQPGQLEILRLMLDAEGFDTVVAQDGLSGLRTAYQVQPDAILLDVMMPNMDGFEVCRRLREMTEVPIIFLTAKGTLEDIVKGLSLGADDYLVKPFDRLELVGRLRACLRRAKEQTDKASGLIFATDSVMLDCGRHELVIGKKVVDLTPKEFEVLRLLIHHVGKVLNTNAILARVWGAERVGEPDLVKQCIYRLRQKIEPTPKSPRYLHTVWGEGYYFDTDEFL